MRHRLSVGLPATERSRRSRLFAFGLVIALVATAGVGLLPMARSAQEPPALPTGGARSASTSADTVSFGVLGDWSSDKPDYPISVAELKRLVARGGTFVLAVGDLGYQPGDEANWCAKLKAVVNDTLVVAGNHDDGTNTGGLIGNYVQYCPFNMDAALVAGPTYGYGISYYFDVPRLNPLARIIMITPGQTGTPEQGENYNPGGAEYNWVLNAVADARTRGIPWVFAGMHRLCINAGSYGCEIGQAFWDALITAGVDVLFTGHYHVYERSYQLNHGPGCTTVSGSSYNAACVVSFNSTTMTKGAGIVQVTDGAGGTSLYAIDTSNDGQYFPVYMGSNMNSQGKNPGWSPSIITLNATTLTGSTAFCPGGTTDGTGECASAAPGTFQDSFTITSGAAPPPPPPQPTAVYSFSPTAPDVGQAVTFTASASGGTAPYTYSWTFGDGATGSGAAVSHTYSVANTYTVVLTVTDAASQTASATHAVTVAEPQVPPGEPPVTSLSLTGRMGAGSWYTSAVTVTLTATSSSSASVTIAYQLDGGEWRTYTAPFQVADGLHILEYNATDDAGHAEANQTARVKVDSLPPVLMVPPSGLVRTTASFEFSWDASDAVSGVAERAVSLDGVPSAAFVNETRMTLTLPDGGHTVGLRATDGAGNRAWANVTLRVDTNVFSPTGPLQGMPSYVVIAIVAGVVLFLILHRRARAKRARKAQDLSRKRTYDR